MKKLFFIVFALAAVLTLGIVTFAQDTEITISYVNIQDPSSTTTSLDTVAYTDGKQVVKAGEEFTLPTTANVKHIGEAGYQLIWYTGNGRTYKAGETVSFNEDTRLYRCMAKEAATSDELASAMAGDTKAAILTADIERTAYLYFSDQSNNVIVLNGHNLSFKVNNNGMGDKRTGKHIIGQGKLSLENPNGEKGKYYIFNSESHGWFNDTNKGTIGVDVELYAPNYHLFGDGNGSCWDGLPYFRIFGKVNIWSFGNMWVQANKTCTIEIFEGAEVTLNATQMFYDNGGSKGNNAALRLYIHGGTFNLPENAAKAGWWTNDIYDEAIHKNPARGLVAANTDKILISGGTFNVKLPDGILRVDNKALEYNEANGTYSVVDLACPNGEHNYVKAEAYEGIESSCTVSGIYYYRCECGAYKTGVSPELGHSYTIVSIEKEATVSELGVKRADCDRCDDYYTYEYSFSPLEIEVTITVVTDGAQREVTLLAGDVFDFTVVDTTEAYSCTITGVKNGTDYTKKDIVKLQIPSGLMDVASGAISDMSLLKEIVIMDYATVTFKGSSIKNCPALEKLVSGNETVTFSGGTVSNCPAFATLDVTKGNATFNSDAFKNNRAIKDILMAAGNTYTFGGNSFNNSGLTRVVFPDNSNIVFSGAAAFYGSPNLTYAYFGVNCITDKKLNNKPFDCCYSLETVILMDIIYVNEYTFCCNGNASSNASHREGVGLNKGALNIYSHSETISFNQNTFANRGVLGVNLYTVSDVTALSGCAYTIYAGLPHAYTHSVITESTCVTQGTASFVTDCPCGADYRTNAFTTYSTLNAEINGVENEALGTDIVDLPLSEEHTPSELVKDIEYRNGATELGTKIYKCLYCDATTGEEEEPSFPAMFIDYGYSYSTYAPAAIMQCFGVDSDVRVQFTEITGKDIDFGVVAAVKETVNTTELIKADGTAAVDGVLYASCKNREYSVFELKITGLEDYKDVELYCSAYYIIGGEVYYIDNGISGREAPLAITYNKIADLIENNTPIE